MNSNEIVSAQKLELTSSGASWGAADEMTVDDFIISKVLLMQGLSEQVTEGNARMGEYRDSVSGELYAGVGENFEVIVFHREMTWTVFKDDKYIETIPVNDSNRDLPTKEGNIERNKTFNYYMLPVKQLSLMKEGATPVIISMKRSGIRTAKTLQKYFHQLKAQGLPSAAKVICLAAKKESNELGTFYTPTFSEGRDSTKEEIDIAYHWYQIIKKASAEGKIKVDNSEDKKPIKLDEDTIPF